MAILQKWIAVRTVESLFFRSLPLPPLVMKLLPSGVFALMAAASPFVDAAVTTTAYSHGNPSNDEQYLLELINRARANPKNEGVFLAGIQDAGVKLATGFFKVDTTRMKSEFRLYPVQPPLAFNPDLLASAKRHSTDMATNVFQEHTGTDSSTITSRIEDTGFIGVAYGENIYSDRVTSPFYAHAGLNIDWGPGAFGVLPGVPHRTAIMGFAGPPYREIGIGVSARTKGDLVKIGKFAVTQDFGTRLNSPDFLVGVAYYDVNKDGLCDPGEGIPNIRVQPSTGTFHAITSSSGGYAIPFTTPPGNARVAFSGGGLSATTDSAFFINGSNAKVDLRITTGTPFVYLKPLDSTADEKGGGAKFRIVRAGPVTEPLDVSLSRPVVARAGFAIPADYLITAVSPAKLTPLAADKGRLTLTIPKNAAFADVNLKAVVDKKAEGRESVSFEVLKARVYRTGSPSIVSIAITD